MNSAAGFMMGAIARAKVTQMGLSGLTLPAPG